MSNFRQKIVLGCVGLTLFCIRLQANTLPEVIQSIWTTKNIEIELSAAKSRGQEVLIYWGAEWCPPCNAMKAEVFSKREFQEATKDMLRIMIDGDSTDAQRWSDRFRATGYPSIIILGGNGNQLVRFLGYTNLETLTAAIKFSNTSKSSIFELAGKVASGTKIPAEDLRVLAMSDWTMLSASELSNKSTSEVAMMVIDSLPQTATTERAQMIQSLMYGLVSLPQEDDLAKKAQDQFSKFMEGLTSTESTRRQSLPFFAAGGEYLKWFLPSTLPADIQKGRVSAWLNAVELVASAADSTSLSERLNAASAFAMTFKFVPTDPKLLAANRIRLNKLKGEINALTDQHQLTSLVPELADAYEAIGDVDVAIKLLKRAASKSNVPHYFLGHLAYFLEQTGKSDEALIARKKALEKARGNATKIQWTWSYIKAVQNKSTPDAEIRLDNALVSMLTLAGSSNDGYEGRNLRYLNLALETFRQRSVKSKKLSNAIEDARQSCFKAKDLNFAKSCSSYFEKLTTVSDTAISKKSDIQKGG